MSIWSDESFTRAMARHRDLVFRVAYTYMRDAADADDVAQAVFVKLLGAKAPFESDDHLKNWLVKVTVNECRSLFRKPWRRVEDIEAYAHALALPTREHGEVLVAVMRLPERYRVPIVLHYYGRFSTDEIAGLTGVKPATVRKRLARARGKLKLMIEEGDHGREGMRADDARVDGLHARV